jgi:hypothetical protein
MLIGLTIPSWGPRVAGPFVRHRTFRRLGPLWSLVHGATPEISLDADGGGLRDLEYRLVRRIVEIRDGWLALRPYLDERTAETAQRLALEAGLPPERARAAVHAALLTDAARAKSRGEVPARVHEMAASGGNDLAEETAELLRVAQELTSPVVRPTTV